MTRVAALGLLAVVAGYAFELERTAPDPDPSCMVRSQGDRPIAVCPPAADVGFRFWSNLYPTPEICEKARQGYERARPLSMFRPVGACRPVEKGMP